MARELVHRVKNSFAVIQSIVRQTQRSTPDPEAFAEAFGGRLAAMAASHDLLTDRHWEGAALRELVSSQLAAFAAGAERRVHVQGPEVTLDTSLAVPLGLALHELATNATKYGSLSRPGGSVQLSWTVGRVNGAEQLSLTWREIGGPPVTTPSRRGFRDEPDRARSAGRAHRAALRARRPRVPHRTVHERSARRDELRRGAAASQMSRLIATPPRTDRRPLRRSAGQSIRNQFARGRVHPTSLSCRHDRAGDPRSAYAGAVRAAGQIFERTAWENGDGAPSAHHSGRTLARDARPGRKGAVVASADASPAAQDHSHRDPHSPLNSAETPVRRTRDGA